MDERAIRRLLIIVAISLIVIFLVRKVISGSIVNLNRIVAEKKRSGVSLHTPQPMASATPDTAVISETPPAAVVDDAAPLESPSVSGVGVSN
jgi:hypothetical protein